MTLSTADVAGNWCVEEVVPEIRSAGSCKDEFQSIYELTEISKPVKALKRPALDISQVPKSRQDPSDNISPGDAIIPASPDSPRRTVSQARFRRNSRLHLAALCWAIFTAGWNDGSTGPLLPRLQNEYHVGFAVVSLIFVANCVGFISGGALNVWITDRFGLGKVMVFGAACQLVAYAILSPAPPFPAIVCAYGLLGFGLSLQNAQANGFIGSLKEHMSTKLGMLHGAYGFGAFASPLVATQFSALKHWSFHFLISGALTLSNITCLIIVFRLRAQEEILAEAGQEPSSIDHASAGMRQSKFSQMMGLPAVHLLAVFAIIYIGVEVTLGGWIVTFIIQERDGGHSAGYISSGFFGGLTLGRLCLIWFNKLVGEQRVMFFYSFLAIALEITIWFVPSIIGNAVAVSIIGLLLGPMFPILVSHSSRILPRWLLTGSVGWITGIGVSGSAALPLVTGLLASKYGIRSLQPLMVSMMSVMLLVWACVPKAVRRVD